MTSAKFRNTRMNHVRNTWGADVVFFSDERADDVIFVSDDDSYASNVEKTLCLLRWHLDKDFNCLVVGDDDTWFNIPNLEKELKNHSQDELEIIGCKINMYKPDKKLDYCSGGGGYVMNKKTLELLCKNIKTDKIFWADVIVGMAARKAGIKITHCDNFHFHNPAYHDCKGKELKEAISFHYMF